MVRAESQTCSVCLLLILAANIMDLVVQDLGALALLCFYGSVGGDQRGM
jgi:hypothetical protein